MEQKEKIDALQGVIDKALEIYKEGKTEIQSDGYELNKKYEKFIPKEWYGFDIGMLIPSHIMTPIIMVSDALTNLFPDVHILQVKWKFGGLRYYVHNVPKEVDDMIFYFTCKIHYKKATY